MVKYEMPTPSNRISGVPSDKNISTNVADPATTIRYLFPPNLFSHWFAPPQLTAWVWLDNFSFSVGANYPIFAKGQI